MNETRVIIEGGATNKSFVLELLDAPEVVGGEDGIAPRGVIRRRRAGSERRREGDESWMLPSLRRGDVGAKFVWRPLYSG